MQQIRTALIGLGNVNRSFLKILEEKSDLLRQRYGLAFQPVLVADSSGVAVKHDGFEPGELRRFKEGGGRVCELSGYQPQGLPQILAEVACDLLLEASPVNLKDGEPGLSVTRVALQQGINVVLANKGPLVLAFHELQQLAQTHQAGLAYSATVCGALPVINIGQRDLIAAKITLLRGIFNSTTNFILGEMTQERSFAEALAEAQRRGIAEADPSLDVDGWDTANKLVIIANSFLGMPATLAHVKVVGIGAVTTPQLQAQLAQGKTIKLLATAQRNGEQYTLTVAPTILARNEFLAGCDSWEMGVEIHSDLYGKMYYKIWENDPLPTASAMLRDAVNLFTSTARS